VVKDVDLYKAEEEIPGDVSYLSHEHILPGSPCLRLGPDALARSPQAHLPSEPGIVFASPGQHQLALPTTEVDSVLAGPTSQAMSVLWGAPSLKGCRQ
jgi:hypothetical protein